MPLAASNLGGDGAADLLIGVTFDRVGAVDAAGTVDLVFGTAAGLTGAGSTALHQDLPGLASEPAISHMFGAALGVPAS